MIQVIHNKIASNTIQQAEYAYDTSEINHILQEVTNKLVVRI